MPPNKLQLLVNNYTETGLNDKNDKIHAFLEIAVFY